VKEEFVLFTLRFRGQTGVREKLIEASSDEKAELVGRAACSRLGATFMLCERALIADESILAGPAAGAEVEPDPLERPSLQETRERQKHRNAAARAEA
jgi:hypothetical protein